jgi:uncharacterized damage-inducible protein DinB
MITAPYIQAMAAYNAEMNRRWYAAAGRLTDAERREERGAFFGSLHGTLCHILWADRLWMHRFAGWERPPVGQKESPRMIADFMELSAARLTADAAMEDWAATVTQDWLDGELAWFSGSMQRELRQPRALLVVHMFNHQTHHRGQVHAMLTALGEKTGDTDLPFVLPG